MNYPLIYLYLQKIIRFCVPCELKQFIVYPCSDLHNIMLLEEFVDLVHSTLRSLDYNAYRMFCPNRKDSKASYKYPFLHKLH